MSKKIHSAHLHKPITIKGKAGAFYCANDGYKLELEGDLIHISKDDETKSVPLYNVICFEKHAK